MAKKKKVDPKMIKWTKANGTVVATNTEATTIEAAEALGWKREGSVPVTAKK